MTEEKQLINKTYFEAFLEHSEEHPIQVLGEAYLAEQKKEIYDLSYIRFAQGEVYFHNKDYETAIFKWENINNELEPWAKKNIGDAYYELGLLSAAEDVYILIDSESVVLTAEVALKLFSLYVLDGNIERAYEMINKAIAVNPDYPNVTTIAREFYEEQKDFDRALELAVYEAIRTEELGWFKVIKNYIEQGCTKTIAPNYFTKTLSSLYRVDNFEFKQLMKALWHEYRQTSYLQWIKTVNEVFLNIEATSHMSWEPIGALFKETYLDLLGGKFLVKELHEVVPDLLANWLKVTPVSQSTFVSAAILSWNEVFPSTIGTAVKEAENRIFNSVANDTGSIEYSLDLLHSIATWSDSKNLEVSYKLNWFISSLTNLEINQYLVASSVKSGKSSFINTIVGENIVRADQSSTIILSHDDQLGRKEILDEGEREVLNIYNEQKLINTESFFDVKLPSHFLYENKCRFIVTPDIGNRNDERQQLFDFLPLADGLLFILDANEGFTEKERELLAQLKKQAADMKIHFILNNIDLSAGEEELERVMEEIEAKIKEFSPRAELFPYLSSLPISQQLDSLSAFVNGNFQSVHTNKEETRNAKILYFVRQTLNSLLKKRVENENNMIDSINWNEDILDRLNGFSNHLYDMEKEKAGEIKKAFERIKTEIRTAAESRIPLILRECAGLINDNSDFKNIHIELNEKMNEKVQDYLQDELLPKYMNELQQWIRTSDETLHDSQTSIDEMCVTFSGLYEEKEKEKLKLECNFSIISDWTRDIERMESRSQIENENILLRHTPAQILLKGAGKLFGAISQNKSILANQYKRYLENESFADPTASIINKFFLQFDLFEKGLTQDVNRFFKEPFARIKEIISETETEISRAQEYVETMKSNPEVYYDPLTLFEVRLLQYEFMIKANKEISYSN
ncbi:GTP-binding protein [Metabacillus fastidiosus]|uniref:GTP-binding protein n=1 Tax=Metabacillus fastidiosus TaxID=1458 RepID=UPI003D2D5D54